MQNQLLDCDFCGRPSELVEGACSECAAKYNLAPRREFDDGEHSANDVPPALIDRRKQSLHFDLQMAPAVMLDKLLRPLELVVSVHAEPADAPIDKDSPLLFGRRWDDRQAGDAWQESLGVETAA